MDSPDTVASGSPHAIHARAQGASVVQVESSRLVPWLMLTCVMSALALAASIFGFYEFTVAEREFRLLQNQQQMTNAWLARMGAVSPMDVYQGPEGNFFFKPPPKGK